MDMQQALELLTGLQSNPLGVFSLIVLASLGVTAWAIYALILVLKKHNK